MKISVRTWHGNPFTQEQFSSVPTMAQRGRPRHRIRRSRGCRTCRRRHLACDEQQPVCQNCTNSGIPCDGFAEPTLFVDDHPLRGIEVPSIEPSGPISIVQSMAFAAAEGPRLTAPTAGKLILSPVGILHTDISQDPCLKPALSKHQVTMSVTPS